MRALRTVAHLIAGCLTLVAAPSASASMSEARTACISAARRAEAAYGIPGNLLQAISLVETGRGPAREQYAWPWTVNVAQKGYYFSSEIEAKRFVAQLNAAGATSFDIGCFQINTKWHGTSFASHNDMFDPDESAVYAAQFLSDLKAETGDWTEAARLYHSRVPEKGQSYGRKLAAVRQALAQPPQSTPVKIVAKPPPLRDGAAVASAGAVALTLFKDKPPLVNANGGALFMRMDP